MIVNDLMSQFRDFKVVAGNDGIKNQVKSVTVMDAPDIYKWMRGGEFLITTAYIMKNNPLELVDLVVRLYENGASALGIKVNRFLRVLPKELLDIANELKFPIIDIPDKYSFRDIINPVMSEIISSQTKQLEMSYRIHKSFTDIAVKGKGMDFTVKTLSSIIESSVIYVDVKFDRSIYCILESSKKQVIRKLSTKELLSIFKNYEVKIGSITYGYVVILDENHEESDFIDVSVEHASTVLKLEIQKYLSNRQIEGRYRDELILDLIMNNINSQKELDSRAKNYGWNFRKGLVAVIIDIDRYKERYTKSHSYKDIGQIKEKIFNLSKIQFKNSFKNVYYTNFSDSIVFLIEPEENFSVEFLNRMKNTCDIVRDRISKETTFTVSCGIGGFDNNPLKAYESYKNATKAIKVSRSMNHVNKTLNFDELGVYNLIFRLSQESESLSYCEKRWRSIKKYDSENHTDYFESLKALIENDWNIRKTSEELFIHYNTMKYRYKKIQEILVLDFSDSNIKFEMEMCMKILDLNKRTR